eukprot:m.366476 g.366476  ORF g.366476 m.366476 type:complete len:311 (+) comp56069_c0_seq3:765-1697(+)
MSTCLECLAKQPTCPHCNRKFAEAEKATILARLKGLTLEFSDAESAPQVFTQLTVSLLDGRSFTVDATPQTAVVALKEALHRLMRAEPGRMRLMYEQKQMLDRLDGKDTVCGQFINRPSRTVQLMVLMRSIESRELDSLKFQLQWSFPQGQKNRFLDATCFAYDRRSNQQLRRVGIAVQEGDDNAKNPIYHHGDDFPENQPTIGRHTIDIRLRQLEDNPNIRLYLVLSAYKAPTMAHGIHSQTVRLFDERSPQAPLCADFQLATAVTRQAVVMCYLDKTYTGWDVVTVGRETQGDIRTYGLIEATLVALL